MRLSGVQLPFESLSATSLADAVLCPERWRRERILGEWGKKGLDAFKGSVHHRALESLLCAKLEGIVPENGDLDLIYTRAFLDQLADEPEPEWTEKPETVSEQGKKMLASAVATILPSVTPVLVEERFTETLPGIPIPITGKIDVICQDFNTEFKTTKNKLSKPKAKWRFQAMIYQIFSPLPTYWGITTKQVTPQSVWAGNEPGLILPLGNPDTTIQMIAGVVEMLNDLYVRYGPYRPWPLNGLIHDWACQYCTFGPTNPEPTCPAWRSDERATEPAASGESENDRPLDFPRGGQEHPVREAEGVPESGL